MSRAGMREDGPSCPRSVRLSKAIVALAEPAEDPEVAKRRPPTPGRSEHHVFEFDEAYTAFVEGFVRLPSEAQLLALQAVDRRLATMVAAKDAALWTDRARREHPVWDEVRRLAIGVLVAFDWPNPHV